MRKIASEVSPNWLRSVPPWTSCVAGRHAVSALDRLFWLGALAGEMQRRALASRHRDALFSAAARVINTTFRVPPRERQDALLFLADRLVPLN